MRPELILSGWNLGEEGTWGVINVATIENAGNGHALHLRTVIEAVGQKMDPMDGIIVADYMPILRKGETRNVNWKAMFLRPKAAHLDRMLDLTLVFTDVNGNRYETNYRVLANVGKFPVGGCPELAPRLYLVNRTTKVSPESRWFPGYR